MTQPTTFATHLQETVGMSRVLYEDDVEQLRWQSLPLVAISVAKIP
jgi:hypothetical protein